MGDKNSLARARQELEDLYLGVPDESVDLTFKDMASFQQTEVPEKKAAKMDPIHEEPTIHTETSAKSPSIEFPKGLQETGSHQAPHANVEVYRELVVRSSFKRNNAKGPRSTTVDNSYAYGDASGFSKALGSPYEKRVGGIRRPGIPHSNICTLCSNYIYIFRHRCLVCGRMYCRQCVGMGMGEMTEGRKCIACLGMRLSQRYIKRAGDVGCCCCSRYPSPVKRQELKWAEKGPRRSGERDYRRSGVVSASTSPLRASRTASPRRAHGIGTSQAPFEAPRSRSPVSAPGTPTRVRACNSPPSFVTSPVHSPSIHAIPF